MYHEIGQIVINVTIDHTLACRITSVRALRSASTVGHGKMRLRKHRLDG
jgi:hypothetical protein